MDNRTRAAIVAAGMSRAIGNGLAASVPLFGQIDPTTERDVRSAIERAHRLGARSLRLLVDSNGGDDDLAIKLFRDLIQARLPVTAHAFARCHSAALRPYLAASRRSSAANASFVLHNQTVDAASFLPRVVTAAQLQRAADRVKAGDDDYVELIRNSVQSPWLVASAVRSGVKLNALAAMAMGLTHEIKEIV